MVLRFVERQQKLAKLERRNYTTRIQHASLETMSGDVQQIIFAPGVNVFSGGNGAGKSTLLGALWRCLSGAEPPDGVAVPVAPAWLQRLRVTGSHGNTNWAAELDIPASRYSTTLAAPVFYIDAAAETEEILRQFRSDPSPADLLEGLDPAPLDSRQRDLLAYVLRREYSEFLVYEVTAFSSEDAPLPFFELTSMGFRYSLLQMGRGELAAAYLLWRLHALPPGSIAVLEEPESHLAAFSQENLVDGVVSLAVDRDLCLVVSSHSPGFFQKLPPNHVMLISSIPMPVVRSGLPASQLANHLGAKPRTAAVVLVEDRVAAEFLYASLSALDHDLLRQIDIRAVSSGESGVLRIVDEVASSSADDVSILGILDGDQRSSNHLLTTDKIEFLMGDEAPEIMLRQSFQRWREGEFTDWSPPLPEGKETLLMALERLDGRDLHDWIHELSREFGGLRSTVRAAIDLLLRDASLAEQCRQLVAWLRSNSHLPT